MYGLGWVDERAVYKLQDQECGGEWEMIEIGDGRCVGVSGDEGVRVEIKQD